MFVIINSTPTRINKSHLVDLYERVSWAAPDKKFAAKVVDQLYSEGDSPLRYKINRLGGRSQQEKWILQAELFNEMHRWAAADWKPIEKKRAAREVDRFYERVRDFLKAAEKVWGEAWGSPNFMVTKPGHHQGDAPRVRRPQPRGRRAGRRPPEALGAAPRRLGRAAAPVPRPRASTSASRPRARSSASPASTASWPALIGIEPKRGPGRRSRLARRAPFSLAVRKVRSRVFGRSRHLFEISRSLVAPSAAAGAAGGRGGAGAGGDRGGGGGTVPGAGRRGLARRPRSG